MDEPGKFSGMKLLIIIIIIVVALAAIFYAITVGILEAIIQFILNLIGKVAEAVTKALKKIKRFFGISVIENGMFIQPIQKDKVSALKEQIEAQGIDTDQAGITELMLRKMLLTEAVTSLTNDSLCVAEITEQEILQGSQYNNIKDLVKKERKSEDVWPIDKYKYTLYYITDEFFYFWDTDNMVGNGKDKFYLGVMGTIKIKASNGKEFEYVSKDQFDEAKKNYLEMDEDKRDGSQEKEDLIYKYTMNGQGELLMHIEVWGDTKCKYIFNNDATNTKIVETKTKNKYSTVADVPFNIQDNIDLSDSVVSIELLMDLLNISSSPEYVDKFMDYAIENTYISITAYKIKDDEQTYKKDEYNIKDDFILEHYDANSRYMKAYKSIIYDRMYNGSKFSSSVVDLPDFEDIDYGIGMLDKIKANLANYIGVDVSDLKDWLIDNVVKEDEEDEEDDDYSFGNKITNRSDEIKKISEYIKQNYSHLGVPSMFAKDKISLELAMYIYDGYVDTVDKLSAKLTTAYEAKNISLGEILVKKVEIDSKNQRTWQFVKSYISTWYGTINYDDPIVKYDQCFINGADCSQQEYYDFNEDSLDEYTEIPGDVNCKRIWFDYDVKFDLGIQEEEVNDDSTDISIKEVKKIVTSLLNDDEKDYDIKGLDRIAINDNGKYGGASYDNMENSHYFLYSTFTRTNRKKYNEILKYKMDIVEESTNLPKVNLDKTYNFLAMWKNETGTKGDTQYKSNGKVVQYQDIYNKTTKVGDMFESAPEMLFQLLEMNDSTKSMADIFRYIMYIYTETDYGITNESQISSIVGTIPYSGSDYIVNTAVSSKELVLTKEKLKEAIEKTYSGKGKENLLSCLDDFMYIQENNKVNAVFAIAVATQESSCGTNWAAIDPSTYNWFSFRGDYQGNSKNGWRAYPSFNVALKDFANTISGSIYFKAGKFTVTAISNPYCNPPEQWANAVISHMTKIYNSIGITGATGGTEGKEGNNTTFTVGSRTYKNFKQKEESYKSIPLACFSHTTLYRSGCAITSDAIIASGFGHNVTPVDVNKLGSCDHASIVSKYTGMKCTWVTSNVKQGIIDQLKKGLPVMVQVTGDGGYFRSTSHFLVILSISEDGNSIYISDPQSFSKNWNGWMKTTLLNASGYGRYLKMEAK